MYLVALAVPDGDPAAVETDSDVLRDLKTWGILDRAGKANPAGVASIVMLIEAESPATVAKNLSSNAALDSFFRDVIQKSGCREDKENLHRFALLLRGLLAKAESRPPAPSELQAIPLATGLRPRLPSTTANEKGGPNEIELTSRAVHSLAVATAAERNLASKQDGLRLRPSVLLMPKNSPLQARVIWAVERHLLPDGEMLRDPESYLAWTERQQSSTEPSRPTRRGELDAIFGIYLGTKTCRVSLFSADRRSAELHLYTELLREALVMRGPRQWTHPSVEHSLAGPDATGTSGRRTLTASWIREIDPAVSPGEILGFAHEVWNELGAAMKTIVNPSREFTDRIRELFRL